MRANIQPSKALCILEKAPRFLPVRRSMWPSRRKKNDRGHTSVFPFSGRVVPRTLFCCCCLKKNKNAPRPSEHLPQLGGKTVKTFRWDQSLQIIHNLFMLLSSHLNKTVLTSIQYLLFLTLQGKETNFRGHKLTQNKVQKNQNKLKKTQRKSQHTCEII